MQPLVSVVLPNYNYERYLEERINSILGQTFSDFELIILDDASTDNSKEIIDSFKADQRVQTHFFKKNSGNPFMRWNDGANLATGKYLWIAEADDNCRSQFLERLVAMLEANPNAGMAYCQSQVIDSQGNPVQSCKEWYNKIAPNRWDHDGVYSGQEQLRYLFYGNVIPNASAVLMRRDLYNYVGQADTRYRLVGDWHFWAKMMARTDVAFVSEILNDFRVHDQTVRISIGSQPKYYIDIYEVLTFILSSCTLEIPKEAIESTLSEWENLWFKKIFHKKKLFDLKQDMRLIKASFGMRPKIAGIYAKHLAATVWERSRRKLRMQ
jgi:glycosyltransferase involved in cell wall biosynthesis